MKNCPLKPLLRFKISQIKICFEKQFTAKFMTRLCTTVQGLFGLEQSQEGGWAVGGPLHPQSPLPKRLTASFPCRRLACLLHFSRAAHTCLLKSGEKRNREPALTIFHIGNQGWTRPPPHADTCPAPSRARKASRKMTHVAGRRRALCSELQLFMETGNRDTERAEAQHLQRRPACGVWGDVTAEDGRAYAVSGFSLIK